MKLKQNQKVLCLTTAIVLVCALLASLCLWRGGQTAANPKEKMWSERAGKAMANNQVDTAFRYFSLLADRYAEQRTDSARTRAVLAMNNCGYISLFHLMNYAQSYSYLITALDLAERDHLAKVLPMIRLNLGNLYLACGTQTGNKENIRKATALYRKCFEDARSVKDWDVLFNAFSNLASIADNQGDYKVLAHEGRQLKTLRAPDTAPKRYAELLTEAFQLIDGGQYDRARQLLRQQAHVVTQLDNHEQYDYVTLSVITSTFKLENRTDSAISTQQHFLDLAKAYGNIEMQTNAAQELSRLYAKAGNRAASDRYNMLYLSSKDQLLNRSHLANINEMYLQHEVRTTGEKLRESTARQKTQQVFLLMALLVITVTVLLLCVIILKNRKLNERNRGLYEQNMRLLKEEDEARRLRALLEKQKQESEAVKPKKPVINEDKQQILKDKIQKVLDDVERITSPDFTLARLAELVSSNTSYVSRAVNAAYGCNFSTVLSTLRIREACRRINMPQRYGQYTLETISASVGFKSRATFLTAFKRVTGLLPSEYQRQARNQKAPATSTCCGATRPL